MVRKRKKDKNPYLLASQIVEQFDFIEEIYPEVEVNMELLPVSLLELQRTAEPFAGSDLGDCLQMLCRFFEELERRKCLEAEDIVEAYLAKEQAVFLIGQESSHILKTDSNSRLHYYQIRLESLEHAKILAQRAIDQAGSYYRQMRGKQLLAQNKRFYAAVRQKTAEITGKL